MSVVFLRVSAATVLLSVVGYSLVPYATSYVSTSAVVNAPIISIRAPFDGVVVAGSPEVAAAVRVGDTLVELRNARNQRVQAQALQTSQGALNGEISGINAQIRKLMDLQETLLARREAQITARLSWFTPRLAEVNAEIDWSQVRYDLALSDARRVSQLAKNGLAIQSTLSEAEAEVASASADLAQQNALSARLQIERDLLAGVTAVDLSSSTLEQIDFRLDEIAMSIADLQTRITERKTQLIGVNTQISALSIEAESQEIFTPTAVTLGVVWEASVKAGTTFSAGEPVLSVLDCSRRFLEVTLPERHFESIPPGTVARVKLTGSNETFAATVIAAYGGVARPNSEFQAVTSQTGLAEGFRVIVGLAPVDVTDRTVARTFCDVGRTAEVQFDLPENSFVAQVSARVAEYIDRGPSAASVMPVKTASNLDQD